MWTKLKGYQAFLLCMWNKCFLHCGLHKLMLTCCINTAVNYTLIDCEDFFFPQQQSLGLILTQKRSWTFGLPWRRIRLQWGRPGFDPSVGKIPGRKIRQPTPVLLPGESPWTEEPGGLQSMGLQRVGLDWVTKYSAVVCNDFFPTAIKPKCNSRKL